MKSMRPSLAAIFFMTYFHRAWEGGMAPSAPLDPLLHYDISSGCLINNVTYFISFTNNGKKLFKLTKGDMSEGVSDLKLVSFTMTLKLPIGPVDVPFLFKSAN